MKKKTEKEIRQEVEQRLLEIELLRIEAKEKGLEFSSLSKEQLIRKIKRKSSKSPYIYGMGWASGTGPGSSAVFSVNIANPDPEDYYPMFMTIFFGLGNFFDDISQAWVGRDTRWPELSSRPFSLAAGATTNRIFNYTIPPGVPLSTYIGNGVLWVANLHDKGSYFDRCSFPVTLL